MNTGSLIPSEVCITIINEFQSTLQGAAILLLMFILVVVASYVIYKINQ